MMSLHLLLTGGTAANNLVINEVVGWLELLPQAMNRGALAVDITHSLLNYPY
jgi:hypothetical protein